MALTDVQIRNLKPSDKPVRFFDGGGLYLEITPKGSKLFRYKYRFNKKEKLFAIGKYPDISLADARKEHLGARQLLAKGIDPMEAKKEVKLKQLNSFGEIAKEWWDTKNGGWSARYAHDIWHRLEKNILPFMKNRPVEQISTGELLGILRKMEARGAIETAHRVGQICSQVFVYAIAMGYLENNPANSISKVLKERKATSMPAITDPRKIAELLRAIDGFEGTFVVKCALAFLPLTFVRPGELRFAEWAEFDLDNNLWVIPAEKMKMKRDHIVPLSKQAVEILRELYFMTGEGKYVFPSVRTNTKRPISENTINAALRRLGYSKEEMCAHGFRTMASTRLHEMGWQTEIVEFQLAHADKNKIRGIYNRATYLEERKRMMQAWANYLDSLRKNETVIPFRRTGDK